jgi:hypothetical protein
MCCASGARTADKPHIVNPPSYTAFLSLYACLLGEAFWRQDAIGVAVQNERRDGLARNVLAGVLNPCINDAI